MKWHAIILGDLNQAKTVSCVFSVNSDQKGPLGFDLDNQNAFPCAINLAQIRYCSFDHFAATLFAADGNIKKVRGYAGSRPIQI